MATRAGAKNVAVGEDDFEAHDITTGDAVLQAAWAAGVGGDVSTQGAFLEGGGIGRVIPADVVGGVLEIDRNHAGLDDGESVGGVELEDLGHTGYGEGDAPLDGNTTADVADSSAAGGDGDAVLVGVAEDVGNIFGAFREDDEVGEVGGIPLVDGMGLENLGEAGDLVGAEEFLQGLDHGLGLAGKGGEVTARDEGNLITDFAEDADLVRRRLGTVAPRRPGLVW